MPVASGVMKQTSITPPAPDSSPPGRPARGGIAHAGLGHMSDGTVSNQRRLPDPEVCRTEYLGRSLVLSKCLVENPDLCRSALDFGFGVYCSHPDRRSFEKTGLP